MGVITLLVAGIHVLWQYALTGNPLQNPYLLWWPYDKVGFGEGHGIIEGGHSLHQGWVHTKHSLQGTTADLLGWGAFTWLFVLLGLWAVRRFPKVWLIACVFPTLVVIYLPYWVSGPRYFFEGLYSLTILIAAGIAWLAGWMPGQRPDALAIKPRIRQGVVLTGLFALLVLVTLPYAPQRLYEVKARYGFSQADLAPFRTAAAQELTPAKIIIHAAEWWDYGVYLHLQDARLTTPFVFVWAGPDEDPSPKLAPYTDDRTIYHYYPDEPGVFYPLPRP